MRSNRIILTIYLLFLTTSWLTAAENLSWIASSNRTKDFSVSPASYSPPPSPVNTSLSEPVAPAAVYGMPASNSLPPAVQPPPATTLLPPPAENPFRDPFHDRTLAQGANVEWNWQFLPDGLLYQNYLASPIEPRIGAQWIHTQTYGWVWDISLGGHIGLFRYGNSNPQQPEGWQLDLDGAAFPRLNLERQRDLDNVDFRFGVPLTYRIGPWEAKFGYYHLSSHRGDEWLVTNGSFDRLNYVREQLVLGVGYRWHPDWRIYAETDYAFYTDGGAEPWEFQTGIEYSPAAINRVLNSPFLAIHGRFLQNCDFGGSFTVQTGWQWRSTTSHLFRIGVHYQNGMSNHSQDYNLFEEQVGVGMWYDY